MSPFGPGDFPNAGLGAAGGPTVPAPGRRGGNAASRPPPAPGGPGPAPAPRPWPGAGCALPLRAPAPCSGMWTNVTNRLYFKEVHVSVPNSPQRRGGEHAGLGHRKCTWRHVNFHPCLKNLEKSAHDCRGGLENSSNRAKEVRIRALFYPLRWSLLELRSRKILGRDCDLVPISGGQEEIH
uniref:homeobox protein Hox-D4-like n=1 Tax=Halichoerus grypus TaxID=9711 RepID=UPI00165967DC|nr:homeobox protein Hox-D4-like [Halichoerus grypus]